MIDNVEIEIKAGSGGKGSIHFRREKFIPRGGPDGGDGGGGGSVVVEGTDGRNTLSHFRYGQKLHAEPGRPGQGGKKRGRDGNDLVIQVPLGTVVSRIVNGSDAKLITDIIDANSAIILCSGGVGGKGNVYFASSTNQTPIIAEAGGIGETARIRLELKLLADVGVVGIPNAGKSSLVSLMSMAKPKIAAYPFTTTEPVLGVVEAGGRTIVIAEIPGLIQGAHRGVGLGYKFLRHAERTRVLLHLLDGSSDKVRANYLAVNQELLAYDKRLAVRPQIIVINKVDLPEVRNRINEIQTEFSQAPSQIFFMSAATGEGVELVLAAIVDALSASPTQTPKRKSKKTIPRSQRPKVSENTVLKRGPNQFMISWPKADQLVRGTNLSDWRALAQVRREFQIMGLLDALNRAGVQVGDTVSIGDADLEWQ